MEEFPKRTFVENPDAYLSEFTIGDHVRDVDFNVQKLKNAVESLFKDYPGFITYPKVVQNIFSASSINISPFLGIDGNRNVITYPGGSALSPTNLEVGIFYYIICRGTLKTTDDISINPKQQNKSYFRILEEKPEIIFSKTEPYKELVIGQVKFNINTEGIFSAEIINENRSDKLPNIYDVYDEVIFLKENFNKLYVRKANIINDGDTIADLTEKQVAEWVWTPGQVMGISKDKTIDERFISKERITDRLFEEIILPAPVNNIPSEKSIILNTRFKNFKISNNTYNIYGEYVFKANGSIEEIEVSDKVYTTENAEFFEEPNTIFISSSALNDKIQLTFKNNFTTSISIQFYIR